MACRAQSSSSLVDWSKEARERQLGAVAGGLGKPCGGLPSFRGRPRLEAPRGAGRIPKGLFARLAIVLKGQEGTGPETVAGLSAWRRLWRRKTR